MMIEHACAENQLSCVKFLTEKARVDLTKEDRWGNTPLQVARRLERTRIAEYLEAHSVLQQNGDAVKPSVNVETAVKSI